MCYWRVVILKKVYKSLFSPPLEMHKRISNLPSDTPKGTYNEMILFSHPSYYKFQGRENFWQKIEEALPLIMKTSRGDMETVVRVYR
ncbi:MAG: hypothetical protein ACI8Y7_001067 [Candidatus Woesearchaeota archaeon]|jgi:hypothetical protein